MTVSSATYHSRLAGYGAFSAHCRHPFYSYSVGIGLAGKVITFTGAEVLGERVDYSAAQGDFMAASDCIMASKFYTARRKVMPSRSVVPT